MRLEINLSWKAERRIRKARVRLCEAERRRLQKNKA